MARSLQLRRTLRTLDRPGQLPQLLEHRHRQRSAAGDEQARAWESAAADAASVHSRDQTVGTPK